MRSLYFISESELVNTQWNPSIPDTVGTNMSVMITGVSSFQGVLNRGVSLYIYMRKTTGCENWYLEVYSST